MEQRKTKATFFDKMSPTEQYEYIRRKQMTTCLLCLEGKKMRDQLADHFIVHHSDALNDDDYTHFCNCADAIQLQMKLLNHMLKHVIRKRKQNCKRPLPKLSSEVIVIDTDDEEGGSKTKSQAMDDNGNESDDYFVPFTKGKPKPSTLSYKPFVYPYKCTHCDKTFKFPEHLRIHRRSHFSHNSENSPKTGGKTGSNEKTMCEKCSQMVPANKMNDHLRLQHFSDDPKEKPLKCDFPECTAAFRSDKALQYHRNAVHICSRPFMCEFCSDTFGSELLLLKHRIRHTDPDKWRCDVCQKTYVDKRQLNKHNRVKHNETLKLPRPYCCDKCPKTYVRHRDLCDHIQKIHVEGPNEKKPNIEAICQICSKSFSTKSHLKRHMTKSHDVVESTDTVKDVVSRPEPRTEAFCHICEKILSRKSHLKRHMRNVHHVVEGDDIEDGAF